jgi:hypothetical protein
MLIRMSGSCRTGRARLLLAALLACGPTPDEAASSTDHGSSTAIATATVTGTSSGTSTSGSSGGASSTGPNDTAAPTDADSSSGDSTGKTFIVQSDGGACSQECDIFQPDSCCDPKLKCVAYADGGGSSWNALRCVPIARNPDQPGEPCTVVESNVSGIDSCDQGAMCWDVDNNTLEGVCVALCTGTPEDPVCPLGTSCAIENDGVLALCLPNCDPLVQDCPGDDLCIAADHPPPDHFLCVFDASGDEGQAFDPCQFVNACDSGLACVDSENSAMCDARAPGCCLPFCDLALPECPGDTACVPWYPIGTAPAGLEKVGLCGKP